MYMQPAPQYGQFSAPDSGPAPVRDPARDGDPTGGFPGGFHHAGSRGPRYNDPCSGGPAHLMTRRFTIGRDKSCDIPIADDSVSRVHAEVWLGSDGMLKMSDSGSSNGTHVIRNGESFPLRKDAVLPTDQIRFGSIVLGTQDVIEAIEARNPGSLRPAFRASIASMTS